MDAAQQQEQFDAHMAEESVTRGHRVVLEFDGGGMGMKLIHPETGCKESTQCGRCAADLTDPESTRCYDCKGQRVEECWLTGWFDNLVADEILHGSVEFPVSATFDGDHPQVKIVPESAPNVLTPDEALEVEELAAFAEANHIGLTAEQRILLDRLKTWAEREEATK